MKIPLSDRLAGCLKELIAANALHPTDPLFGNKRDLDRPFEPQAR